MSKSRNRNKSYGASNPLRNQNPKPPMGVSQPTSSTVTAEGTVGDHGGVTNNDGIKPNSSMPPPKISPLEEAQSRIKELSEQLEIYQLLEQELRDGKKDLDEREEALSNKEASIEQQIRTTLENAKAETIAQVQLDEAQIRKAFRDSQQAEIDALRSEAEKDAERICQEASDAAKKAQHEADEAGVKICQEAKEYAQQMREEAQTNRDKISNEADVIIANAEKRRVQILELAQLHANTLITQAQEQAINANDEWNIRLSARENELMEQARALARKERELDQKEIDIDQARSDFQSFRAKLNDRWALASPERVKAFEIQLSEAQRLMSSYQEQIRDAQSEIQRLSRLTSGEDGRSLDVILEELERTKARCRELREQQESMPSDDELEALRHAERENIRFREDNRILKRRCLDYEARAQRIELGNMELSQMQAQVAGLKALHEDLTRELEANSRALQGRSGKQFEGLTNIDQTAETPRRSSAPILNSTEGGVDLLKRLLIQVRQFAASQPRPLYYSETTLRTFLSGMAASRLCILQGLSGTGKSSLPRVFAAAIDAEFCAVSVQSNWRDRHELLGYNNDFTRKFTETEFTKAVYAASLPRELDTPWIIMLDEMNLARIEYYFADFLAEMENPDEQARRVPLVPYDPSSDGRDGPKYLDSGRLCLNSNLWFVGTANRDESTFEITDKVYDRAQVLDFSLREKAFVPVRPIESPARVRNGHLQAAFAQAFETPAFRMTSDIEQYVGKLDHFLHEEIGITFGNRILDQMKRFSAVYVASGGTLQEAVDIQIARKVLRKLEGILDPGLAGTLEALKESFLDKPSPAGWGRMTQCTAVIDAKLRRMGALTE